MFLKSTYAASIPLMLGALGVLLFAHPATTYAADKAPSAAFDQSDNDVASPTQHIEGHIAFLHAELGITPEQEPLWKPVADAMRADIQDTENAERQIAHQPHAHESATQYLQNRVTFANLRAQGETRFLTAFQPLYQNLSSHQKAAADDLMVSSGGDQ